MNNKKLLIIAVSMIPFVVISFSFKNGEANFILDNKEQTDQIVNSNDKKVSSEDSLIDSGLNEKSMNYTIKIVVNEDIKELPLEEYIIGVVAGEMPASFDDEALKAQAVASRTYALYKKSRSNGVYDLTNTINNQVYIDTDEMKNKWGAEFEKYYDKIKACVKETEGKVLTYNGEVIEAFYFVMSGGVTQEASSVFNESREYLKRVESKYDNSSLKNYEVTIDISKQELTSKLGLTCTDPEIDYINANEDGYVQTISVCSKEFKGTNFRTLLGLRSTNFKIEIDTDIKITTYGYGHGVGLSQYGANGYANAGYSYEDILKHYYVGVELKDIKDV